jgi:uncharacterized small protein (DUF1192 family)
LDKAEEKRKKLEDELGNMNREWFGKIDSLKQEIERTLTENESKEFKSRLAILTAELNDKNR